MKILTDIGHPKNIHVLKNLVPQLKALGHEFYFVYREREHVKDLCEAFGFSGISRGKGGAGLLGKFFYLLKTDYQLYKLAKKIKPDLLLSFASPYLANLSTIIKKPMIVFDDTEENRIVQKIYAPVADAIVVPACFNKELNDRQYRFQGYFEIAYLHPKYFTPDPDILKELGLASGEKYVLLRSVAWKALHDFNRHGFSEVELESLVAQFSGLARVFISAEGLLPPKFESLRLKTPPESIHQVMAQASLVFSEGATMAAEAAVLGVPAIHFSSLKPGYLRELEERYGLLKSFSHSRGGFSAALAQGLKFLKDIAETKKDLAAKRERMLSESIDVTAFMAWFIDRFPESGRIMAEDPKYSLKFRTFGNRQ
jgi:predicted glycosyltransferase